MIRNGEEIKRLISDGTLAVEELDEASLAKLMSYETDLLCKGEGDMELIKKCSEMLDGKREGEEWEKRFDKAMEKATAPKPRRKVLRRIATVAASVVMLITVSSLVASTLGFNAWAYVIEAIGGKEDSFVFFHNGKGREYASFKELAESEELDIMYPTRMPKGVDIISVSLEDGKDGRSEMRIVTSDEGTCVVIQIAMGQGLQIQGSIGTHVIDGSNYYVFGDSSHYYAFCYYEDDYYSFQASSYDDLMLIIENMEK